MSGTKWEDSGSWSRAFVGDERASVGWMLIARDDRASVIAYNQDGNDHMMVDRRASGRDDAKTVAEQALREMHDALSEHFAPVLRWEDIHPSLSTARLGDWMIDVTNGGWYLFVRCEDGRRLVRHAITIEDTGANLSHAERKRAAEAALRALGVPFRVEGES